MTPAYIALGSNLQNPEQQLRDAVAALDTLPDSRIEKISSVYRSPAVGPGEQPDYLNATLLLNTRLAPLNLLDALQQIENKQGRVRTQRWGARTLDLDLLLYGDQRIESTRLTVPHPAMSTRNFVLYPLADISGDELLLPDGTVLGTLVAGCARGSLVKTAVELHNNPTGSARGAML